MICVIGSDSEISGSDTENGSCVDGNIEEVMEDCADEDTNLFTRTGRVAGWQLAFVFIYW